MTEEMPVNVTEHPDHVYAAATEAGGVHNCPKCGRLVLWGSTTKGNRARFDYPAEAEGRYVNHHVTCGKVPAL